MNSRGKLLRYRYFRGEDMVQFAKIHLKLKPVFYFGFWIFLFGLTPCIWSATYYVDPTSGVGNDSANGTSQATPWQHLPGSVGFSGSGWHSLVNGDMVYVRGGTTNNVKVLFDSTFYSGSSDFDSIRIQSGHLASPAWGTSQAIIDGGATRTGGIIINTNGITVDGFEIRNIAAGANPPIDSNTGSGCIGIIGASYVTVKHCWLHDAYSTSVPTSPSAS